MSAGNGTESVAIAAKAARAAEHAAQCVDGLRDRMDERFDRVESQIEGVGFAIASVEKEARDRGHRLTDALVVMTADVATLRTRIDAQEARHSAVLEELRALRSDLALARSKAQEAVAEARASRPDDGRLTEIAARVLETAADAHAVENERRRESIFARRERRSAVLRWVGQVVGWLTVGGGIVLALQHC
jgi:hypothetical protein